MRFFFIYTTLFLSTALSGQALQFRDFTVQDGLAQSVVRTILPDSRGFVWMGTQGGGLSRYDGLSFVNFSTRQGLPDNRVNALLEDWEGRLWIGTDKGLAYYEGHSIEKWGQRKLNVKALEQDTTGQVWIGTASGLYQLQGQSLQRLPNPARQVNSILTDQSGHTWLGTRLGLWEIVEGIPRQIEGFSIEILNLAEGRDGLLYLTTADDGMFVWNGANFSPFIGNRWLDKGKVESLYSDKEDGVWIGTEGGLYLWDNAGATMQTIALGKEQSVLSMGKDIWGNLWIGSDKGASLFGGQLFEFYPGGDASRPRSVPYVGGRIDGGIYFSVNRAGLFELLDSSAQETNLTPFSDITVNDLLTDTSLGHWLATENAGLLLLQRDSLLSLGVEYGVDSRGFKDLARDSSFTYWTLPREGGLLQLRVIPDTTLQLEVVKWGILEGLPSMRLNRIHIDRAQRLWLCTADAGLLCWKKGALLYQFRKGTGLPTNELISIAEDSTGYLWVGSRREGLMRMAIYEDSIGIEQFTYRQGLYSNTVNSILCKKNGEIWIGSEAGVDRVLLDEDRMPKNVQHFGPSEGFKGVETVPNTSFEDQNGDLWWGTVAGLVKYNASLATTTAIPPGIIMTEVQLFNEKLTETPFGQSVGPWNRFDTSLVFPYDQNNLTFSFLGIEQNQATKIRYQYWLEGWEQAWSVETENKEIAYANLTPGEYSFRVRSIHTDTKLTSEPIQVNFSIQAPWWEWKAVRWGGITIGLGLLAWLFWRQVRKIRRDAQAAAERLRLDKHIMELEQKALQLQMNPHFIFNALNSIQLLIGKQDAKTARKYLAKFSKLMRSTLENARVPKILLAEELESLETYLAIEQFSHGHTFDYELSVVPEGEAEEVYIPPMMVQPFVENAIIHGISPLKEQGKISLVFEVLADEVVCQIKDNGVGLEKEGNKKLETHKSLALQVTRERLELLKSNGASGQQSFEIGPNPGEEGGTYVKIHLPLL